MHDPNVPETLEGWWMLHQMFRVRWPEWQALDAAERTRRAGEAAAALAGMAPGPEGGTAVTTLLGHQGDLMLIHQRRSWEALQVAQVRVARLALAASLEPAGSYVSVLELGLYEMTALIHERLRERGLTPGTPDHDAAFGAEMEEQRRRVSGRLFPEVPRRRHVCFYPMSRRRGELKNWYALPYGERSQMMGDHGKVGRRYAGRVTQFISGSIGTDDWEWGVDLFADDPLVFKKLITEMRYDEVTVWYAEFGPFWVGLQFSPEELPGYLEGAVPALRGER